MTESESRSAAEDSTLVLREWQIFFSYSSYFTQPLPALAEIGARLVTYGIAECAVDSVGNAWWSNDDPEMSLEHGDRRVSAIGTGTLVVEMEPSGQRAKVTMPKGASNYAVECLFQHAQIRYSELKLFGDGRLPPPYIRAFPGMCQFTVEGDDGYSFLLYPQIKIFATGVVIVEFRMFSSDTPLHGREFVDRFVNASMEGFDKLFVPPGIAAWTPTARPMPGMFRWYARPRTAYWHWRHQSGIAEHTRVALTGDFAFLHTSATLGKDLALTDAVTETAAPMVMDAAKQAADSYIQELQKRAEAIHGDVVDGAPRDAQPSHAEPLEEFDEERVSAELERRIRDAALPIASQLVRAAQDVPREPQTLTDLALTMMRVAGVVACSKTPPRTGLSFIVRGLGRPNDIGNFWIARPHVHLIRFRGQSEDASHDAARFADAFGSIIARVWFNRPGVGRRYLPTSLRSLEDHGAYVSKGATLWTYSRTGLRDVDNADTHPDLNRGKLIYEHLAQTELLDYGYALHRRIAERVLESDVGIDDVLSAQRDLAAFEWAAENTGRFGEIRELLETGWEALEVPRLKTTVAQGLSVLQAETTHLRTTATTRATAWLAAVGGMVSVPPLATAVVKPLWDWQHWWLPRDPNAANLFLAGLALGVVGSLIGTGYWLAQRGSK